MRRSVAVIILAAAFTAPSATCLAQFGGAGGARQTGAFQNYVIVEGGQDLSPIVLNIVAQTLNPKLPDWPDEPALATVGFAPQPARLSDDAKIYTMWVNYQEKLQLSDSQMLELSDLARSQLEAALRRIQRVGRESRMQQLEKAIDELTAQQHEFDAVSQKLREELAARRADSIGFETTLGQGLAEALSEQRKLQLEDAGNRARREAVERRIDQLRKEAEASSEADPILKELETLVDIREQQLALVQARNKAGHETAAPLRSAEGELAEARITLLTARRDAEERAGGAALRELNNELSKLMVQAAEIEGRQKELKSMIDLFRAELRKSVQAHAEAERLQQELETVRQRRSHIDARWFEKQRERAELPQTEISLRPLEPEEEKSKPPQ